MAEINYESSLKELFPDHVVDATGPRRYWVTITPDELPGAVLALSEKLDIKHLGTIAGEDMRDHFLMNYIMVGDVTVTLRVKITDREKPSVPSLAMILPGAMVYERETHDILGIVPVGHPDLRRQALPDDWPEGVYPLRKDVKIPRPGAAPEPDESAEGESASNP
ncbi:MAG: NADH-quinone oxidoreductase subunit C [Acidobacteria bacterium]|nr:NADH-quinone oxidoreductase subunit C [Acidobacteriota bacterium]